MKQLFIVVLFTFFGFVAGCETTDGRLYRAAQSGDIAVVRSCLDGGDDPLLPCKLPGTREGEYGESPFHVSCRRGQIAVVKEFLLAGVSPNSVDSRNMSPLEIVINSGGIADAKLRFELVELLMDEGAEVNGAGSDRCPLALAISLRQMHIAEHLISHGCDVEVELRNEPVMDVLLEGDVSPEAIRALFRFVVDSRSV